MHKSMKNLMSRFEKYEIHQYVYYICIMREITNRVEHITRL